MKLYVEQLKEKIKELGIENFSFTTAQQFSTSDLDMSQEFLAKEMLLMIENSEHERYNDISNERL
jgi:hypothetical protein